MKLLKGSMTFSILFVVVAAASIFIVASSLGAETESNYLEITVSSGDTLWKLAEQYKDGHNMSKGQFVEWVASQNALRGKYIYPGDKLLIPVKRTDYPEELRTYASKD